MAIEAIALVLTLVGQDPAAPVETGNLIWDIVQTGGPASVAFFAIVAWWIERRDHRAERDSNRELQQKVIDMAMAQVTQAAKSESAIIQLTDVMKRVDDRMERERTGA